MLATSQTTNRRSTASNNKLEITASYLSQARRFDNKGVTPDVVIVNLRIETGERAGEIISAKGPIDDDVEALTLTPGGTYRFYGSWGQYTHKQTGTTTQQFTWTTFIAAKPMSRRGILKYLERAGQGKGIGPARAAKLYDKFGDGVLDLIRDDIEAIAAELPMIAREDLEKIAAELQLTEKLEAATIDLMDLLEGRGFLKSTAGKAIKEWGNRAADIVRRDPYTLMRFRGCGFKTCDKLYLALGLPAGRLKRQALAAWYAIASNTDGHTWFPIEVAKQGIRGAIGGAELQVEKAITLAVRAKMLRIDESTGITLIAEEKKAANEDTIATAIQSAQGEAAVWNIANDTPICKRIWKSNLTDHQFTGLSRALTGTIAILAGSPGTGKTYSAATVIKAIISEHGASDVRICAPTGKAAQRINEGMVAAGVFVGATTIHSLLGVGQASERDGWSFLHHAKNPIPAKFIIVDESSMIDAALMASLLAARAPNTHILFIGDTNQLPPVGHGSPLRDLIAAGLPCGTLTKIERNSGGIVEACAAIRDGQDWGEGDNLKFVGQRGGAPVQINAVVQELIAAKARGLDPVWDCQVITWVNEKSPLSRTALNKTLQTTLNSNPPLAGTPFRVGDKVINLKNSAYRIFDEDEGKQTEDEQYVANGEQGEVWEIEDKRLLIRLKTGGCPVVCVPRGKAKESDESSQGEGSGGDSESKSNTGSSWDLAYSITAHKSQGSEWPVAIVMVDEYPGAKRITGREAIYTAISRAKSLCLMVGNQATAIQCSRRSALDKRRTLLTHKIKTAGG